MAKATALAFLFKIYLYNDIKYLCVEQILTNQQVCLKVLEMF